MDDMPIAEPLAADHTAHEDEHSSAKDTSKDATNSEVLEPVGTAAGSDQPEKRRRREASHPLKNEDTVGSILEDAISDHSETENGISFEIFREMRYPTAAKSLEERRKKAAKRNLQAMSYFSLVNDRIKELEAKVHDLEDKGKTRATSDNAATGSSKMKPEACHMSWKTFVEAGERTDEKPGYVIDVLAEAAHTPDDPLRILRPAGSDGGVKVECIRINSRYVLERFAMHLGSDVVEAGSQETKHVAPFKLLFACEPDIRAHLTSLKEEFPGWQEAGNTAYEGGDDHTATATTPVDATSKRDAILHFQCVIDFLDVTLRPELTIRRQLRSRAPEITRVSFADLWHLFAPGDLVYDPVERQALLVVAVTGGRRLVSPDERRRRSTHDEDEDDTPIKPVDQITVFRVSCFHLDSNGKEFGPVQREVPILHFATAKDINTLPIVPMEYTDSTVAQFTSGNIDPVDQAENSHFFEQTNTETPASTMSTTVKKDLIERGSRFASFAKPHDVMHQDYRGFSLGKIREQIDSQVILDLNTFYQKNPGQIPRLGLREQKQSDSAEFEHYAFYPCSCGLKACRLRDTVLYDYDDRKVDRALTMRFTADNAHFLRWSGRSSQKCLREKHQHLFPRQIYGYVLRSRTWNALNIDNITDLAPRTQSFDDLVLPAKHKKIVEGLVKTHARGHKPRQDGSSDAQEDRQDDLVRGKGKGLIVLLHGAPGVGKTSTAECVAEYTGRPLFALTCGDIGDNAQDVQKNLAENFSLAHRWGCVMLLDEADVFLQSRDKMDMKRNAVVSVFLRILEYYSGILFLTTNKIGSFDEAFKSRIHVSLYYKALNREQCKEIWKVNFARIRRTRPNVTFNEDALLKWVRRAWKQNEKQNLRPWNGRQIHNACQTAAALAEFESDGKLSEEHLDTVAETTREFDKYLKHTHSGDDFDRARQVQDRNDDGYSNSQLLQPRTPQSQASRSSRHEYTTASSSAGQRKSRKREPSPQYESQSEHSSDDDTD